MRYNGEWLAKMGLVDIIRLASQKTVAQVLTREDFAKRYAEGVDIRLHEIMYPLLQGWDSVMIDADVEMGGSDQLFNNLVGREFQQEDGGMGRSWSSRRCLSAPTAKIRCPRARRTTSPSPIRPAGRRECSAR